MNNHRAHMLRAIAVSVGANSVDYLAGKIQKGSAGVWGQIPMPANAAISAPDAKALAAWVLEK